MSCVLSFLVLCKWGERGGRGIALVSFASFFGGGIWYRIGREGGGGWGRGRMCF